MQRSSRFEDGNDIAAALTRAFHELSKKEKHYDKQERFTRLRRSKFFHDFSYPEIWEVMRAGDWQERSSGEEIIKEGEMDDRFYVIVDGEVAVQRGGSVVGKLGEGDCFGETGYATQVVRRASISAVTNVILMRVSATLLEQASASCQLHFNKVFLRTLLERLARAERENNS